MTASEMRDAAHDAARAISDANRRGDYFDLYSDDIVFHGHGPTPIESKASLRAHYEMVFGAFPDLSLDVLDTIADEEAGKLVVRYRFSATHEGEFRGIPATHCPVDYEGMLILRFSDGKCVERWTLNDRLTLMTQIGAVSPA